LHGKRKGERKGGGYLLHNVEYTWGVSKHLLFFIRGEKLKQSLRKKGRRGRKGGRKEKSTTFSFLPLFSYKEIQIPKLLR